MAFGFVNFSNLSSIEQPLENRRSLYLPAGQKAAAPPDRQRRDRGLARAEKVNLWGTASIVPQPRR
jgi:hypothetical protein